MTLDRIPYANLSSFSRLFATYAGLFDPVAGFFSGDFRDPRQRGQIALQVADKFKNRETVVDVLADQNRSFGMGEATLANVERLSNTDAVAVVTGQQLGLFTGPMYTLHKIITTIQLAKKIEQDTGRPVIPIFWLEGEDHDFDEVASVNIQGGDSPRRISYEAESTNSSPMPVGRLSFSSGVESAITELEEALLPTEFRESLITMVRNAYRSGASFIEAFTALMGPLFAKEGLVFVSGDDPRLKRLAQPLFRKELKEYAKSSQLLEETSSKLGEQYHIQVKTDPTNLFLITDDGRRSLVIDGDRFVLKGTDTSYSQDELIQMVDDSPELFSPNVVLRPIYQDCVLPTAAYVAGPGEIAYFAQFKSLYQWAGVPMPIVYPRASLTVVEKNIAKLLARFELSITDFDGNLDQLFHSVVVDAMAVDADAIFERAGRHIHDAVNTVTPAIEAVDPSLKQSAESTRNSLFKEWSRLKDRVVKAEKRRHEQTRTQLAKCQSNLYPLGIPQERCISPLYFMNKYGDDLVDRLLDTIELDTTSHQVLSL